MDLLKLIPSNVVNSDDYLVFIKVLNESMNEIESLISNFTSLIDIETTNETYLSELSYLLGYNYDFDIDIDTQRDIIKRLVYIYKNRGTDLSIINAATFGSSKSWIGSNMLLPGTDSSVFNRAVITYPSDYLFKYSESTYSGSDKYVDSSFWRDGVVIVELSTINSRLKSAMNKVLPAGVRVYYSLSDSIGGEGIVNYSNNAVNDSVEIV